jgi:cytochrome c
MKKTLAIMAAILMGVALMAIPAISSDTSNPCAANPCAANPCAANPCAANPCAADANTLIRPHAFNTFGQAAALGEKMWNDENLGTSGLACLSCHDDYELLHLDRNRNYPHFVEMVGDVVTLDQMINYCMINPMKGKQFDKNSKELTAMAAYFRAYRMKYRSEHGK